MKRKKNTVCFDSSLKIFSVYCLHIIDFDERMKELQEEVSNDV
jgi:hypothetical protein